MWPPRGPLASRMLNTALSVGAGRAGLPAVEPLFAQSLWLTQESRNAFFVSLTLKVCRSLKASGSSHAEECSRTSEAAAPPTCPATAPFSGRPLAQGEEGLLVGQLSSLRSRISDGSPSRPDASSWKAGNASKTAASLQ